jgi:hypothetical protein
MRRLNILGAAPCHLLHAPLLSPVSVSLIMQILPLALLPNLSSKVKIRIVLWSFDLVAVNYETVTISFDSNTSPLGSSHTFCEFARFIVRMKSAAHMGANA